MESRQSKYRGNGIDESFVKSFKESKLYTDVYAKHSQDLIIGVRNKSINLYYNCDSIADISLGKRKGLTVDIAPYYLNGLNAPVDDCLIAENYLTIIDSSNRRTTDEKKAQHRLVVNNNNNTNSKWFCVDVEYTKGYLNKPDKRGNCTGRFDVVAISKEKPHRIAIIEIKYGAGAIRENGANGGSIRQHIKDFVAFNGVDKDGNSYFDEFKEEVIKILNAESLLVDDVPESLRGLSVADIAPCPEFYVITLDNNSIEGDRATPKMTMGAQLFKDKRWGGRRISPLVNSEGDYFDLKGNDANFKTTFLFSSKTWKDLDEPDIKDNMDIINSCIYDKPITL